MPNPDHVGEIADVAAAVTAHPSVVRLDGGPFGAVASYLPGRRRVLGVRVGALGEPTRLAVVVRPGRALPVLAAELGALVRGVLGPVGVEVTFADIATADIAAADTAPPGPATTGSG